MSSCPWPSRRSVRAGAPTRAWCCTPCRCRPAAWGGCAWPWAYGARCSGTGPSPWSTSTIRNWCRPWRCWRSCVPDTYTLYDIHEDLPLQVVSKDYLPAALRAPVARLSACLLRAAAGLFSGFAPATEAIARAWPAVQHPGAAQLPQGHVRRGPEPRAPAGSAPGDLHGRAVPGARHAGGAGGGARGPPARPRPAPGAGRLDHGRRDRRRHRGRGGRGLVRARAAPRPGGTARARRRRRGRPGDPHCRGRTTWRPCPPSCSNTWPWASPCWPPTSPCGAAWWSAAARGG